MDDIHNLTGNQRSLLVQTVIDARSPVGVWIAERFEALSTREMLSSGAHQGRDYGQAIEIESFWRQKPDRFEKLAMKVADRRVEAAPETEIASFKTCLQDALDSPEWNETHTSIIDIVSNRIGDRVKFHPRFHDWIASREKATGTLRERAVSWRALEILIERELGKKQKSLFESEALAEDELDERDDSSVNNAAELFLAREFDLPYYYGPERIARLASLNIQQFLGLAGEVFEESVAAELLRKSTSLPPRRQHALMKKAAKAVWEDIPMRVRHGRELHRLLESVGNFAALVHVQANSSLTTRVSPAPQSGCRNAPCSLMTTIERTRRTFVALRTFLHRHLRTIFSLLSLITTARRRSGWC